MTTPTIKKMTPRKLRSRARELPVAIWDDFLAAADAWEADRAALAPALEQLEVERSAVLAAIKQMGTLARDNGLMLAENIRLLETGRISGGVEHGTQSAGDQ